MESDKAPNYSTTKSQSKLLLISSSVNPPNDYNLWWRAIALYLIENILLQTDTRFLICWISSRKSNNFSYE